MRTSLDITLRLVPRAETAVKGDKVDEVNQVAMRGLGEHLLKVKRK